MQEHTILPGATLQNPSFFFFFLKEKPTQSHHQVLCFI